MRVNIACLVLTYYRLIPMNLDSSYYTMIKLWFSESLIHSSCELHRSGKFLQNIILDTSVQIQRELLDVDTDTFTIICHICDGLYRVQYNIPRSVLTNISNCLMDGMCLCAVHSAST